MLSLAKEMVVLHQCRLTLIVIENTGNDPFVAGGALIAASAKIVRAFDGRKPQLFRVRVPGLRPERVWDQIADIGRREQADADLVVRRERLTPTELSTDCRLAQATP
jgi:hypothetical protein